MTINKQPFIISVVVPCFNEEETIPVIYRALTRELRRYNRYELQFVDDGSTDGSLSILQTLASNDPNTGYIQLSRNFGHQYALKAGLDLAHGDCVFSMDADMQHDPVHIHSLIDHWWNHGYEVVYTVRDDSRTRSLKTFVSTVFYRILKMISSTPVKRGTADFRLMDRRVVEELRRFQEYHLFLRGIITWMGFKQKGVDIIVPERAAGHSKYSFGKMLRLSVSGIASFSIAPLRLSLLLGLLFAFLSFAYGLYALYIYIFTDHALTGWTSVIASILLLSGIQLIMIGIVGEYIGKIFEQVKQRPGYIIREHVPPSGLSKREKTDLWKHTKVSDD